MKHSFTPGPWRILNDDEGLFPTLIFCGELSRANDKRIVINVSHDQRHDSILANNYLIAAAPELLEALRDLVQLINEGINPLERPMVMLNAQGAINKALGTIS